MNKNKILIGLTGVFLLVTSILLFFILKRSITQESLSFKLKQDQVGKYQGRIYLTLKEIGSDKQNLYYFDLETNQLQNFYSSGEDCYVLGGEVSLNKSEMLISTNCFSENVQVGNLKLNDSGNEVSMLSKSQSRYKREAVRGDGDSFFYQGYPGDFDSIDFNPDKWFIWSYDAKNKKETALINGVHPVVSLDGSKVLALGAESAILYDIKEKTGKRFGDFGTSVGIGAQMDLSDNKDKLVVSVPDTKEILVFRINSWEEPSVEQIDTISIDSDFAFWPKFSSDGNYIVTEEVKSAEKINELVVYNLKTKERQVVKDLSGYDNDYLWINDWK